MLGTRSWLALILFFCTLESHAVTCAEILATYRGDANGAIIHDGKARAQAYPLDFTLQALGLQPDQLKPLGPNVVLLGEGYGTLFPALNSFPDIEVRAVDPIYALNPIPTGFMGDLLREFLGKYKTSGRLLAESSDQTSLPSGWANTVLSNLLINNFLDENGQHLKPIARDTIQEALRIVKPGGKIIFSSFLDPIKLERLVAETQLALGPVPMEIHFSTIELKYDDFGPFAQDKAGQTRSTSITRLVIQKP